VLLLCVCVCLQVRRIPLKCLPKCYRVEHIELYELML
jgi:hypothetical protein